MGKDILIDEQLDSHIHFINLDNAQRKDNTK